MGIKFIDLAESTLAVPLASNGLTATVITGDGAKFPALTGGDYYIAAIVSAGGAYEFVKITAVSGDNLTIVRAQDGTTAIGFSAGGTIRVVNNAAWLNSVETELNTLENTKANATSLNLISVTTNPFYSGSNNAAVGGLIVNSVVGIPNENWVVGTIAKPDGAYEFIKITGHYTYLTNTGLTFTRGQFGTTAFTFDETATITYGMTASFANYLAHQIELKANIASPTFTGTVGGITKSMVGLGNVDNTSDANKPVSSATQTALNLKSDLASPTFTGTPAAPTATAGTNTTQLATTAFVTAASVRNLDNGGDASEFKTICIQSGRTNIANVANGVYSVTIGYDAATRVNSAYSIAIGYKPVASGSQAIAFGAYSFANGAYKIVFNNDGWDRLNTNTHVFQSPYTMIENAGFQNWWYGEEHNWYCNLTGYRTEFLDLTGGTTWATATAYKHSYFVKPTTPNGYYYTRYDNSYPFDDTVTYTPSAGGTVEPTWTTTALTSVTDDSNNGDWICIDLANYGQTFADRMLITEIGFLCYELDSITVGATVSIGTQANGTLFCSGQTINPSAAWQMVNIPITANAVMDLKFNITTLATGVKMRGCFFVKGMYVKDI